MKNIPDMISTKDLSYISDMFNWNLIAQKKFNDYLEYVEDKKIIKLLESLIKMHTNNCNKLLEIIESEEK